jgi:hypothetical protein
MQHPDFTQQLASDRQAHYRTQAANNRLTQPARSGHGLATRSRASDSSSLEPSFADKPNPWLRLRALVGTKPAPLDRYETRRVQGL